ncbi:TonB-dependent receptor [Porphyromonas pogonae]|uniref:TonB-dependent receptor n=1 Tax=Porphyromonas pogonae TaxID=867595 RepID=UPI002E7A58BD|nr:outer membrane beta-barrel protein [Porphyromonas pogonae]
MGASVYIKKINKGAFTDINGEFSIPAVPEGTYEGEVRYVGYKPRKVSISTRNSKETDPLVIKLESESSRLESVYVVAQARKNSEVSLISQARKSLVVTDGISAQQISRTGDSNASDAMKRIPGITLMDNRYVMVRGLNQRYNNVWINGASVPSSDADSRVFSFDQIPSDQLDNMVVVKSPAPEYPSDFSGGFILLDTKDIPTSNSAQISVKAGVNTETHLKDFLYNKGGFYDALGLDGGHRALRSVAKSQLDNGNRTQLVEAAQSGFNPNWLIRNVKPVSDFGVSASINRIFNLGDGKKAGLLASVNYNHTYRSVKDMSNNRLDLYNKNKDEPIYLKKFHDNRYVIGNILGAMLNVSYKPTERLSFSWKNNVNLLGINRYTDRSGKEVISGEYDVTKNEYFYNSRTILTSQLSGTWNGTSHEQRVDWLASYSYSNNNRPDRRILDREENTNPSDPHFGQLEMVEASRQFTRLSENIGTAKADYKQILNIGKTEMTLKTGAYAELRQREYLTRAFNYDLSANRNRPGFIDMLYNDPVKEIFVPGNYTTDKLFINEDIDWTNSYGGKSLQAAYYAALNIPIGKLSIYTGARLEHNRMTLDIYKAKDNPSLRENKTFTDLGIYPSVNMTYGFNEKNQIRLSWGRTINRGEFRELSPAVYYDFELFSDVSGNPELKPAYVHNIDMRYEWYPENNEKISLALFYKNFTDPIEWSYDVAGGSYRYYFKNAKAADNYGAELEIRKGLGFMGLKDFTLQFNGALVKSKVRFEPNNRSADKDRPMQGQSPYMINAALFYMHPSKIVSASILYNRIGKRIVGVGMTDTTGATDADRINNSFPDSYEMPRDIIDLTVGWQPTARLGLKLSMKNILNSRALYKEFPRFIDNEGKLQQREQTTRAYNSGTDISLSASYKF